MPRENKMMQRWSDDAVRFMRDASAYSGFHEQLAAAIAPYLPERASVCDAGCGLGDLSVALCRHAASVTAVDCAEAAISALRARSLPENLRVFCGDIFSMQARYDAMVFCYFGRFDEILRLVRAQCTGRAVVIKRNCETHAFSLGKVPLTVRYAEPFTALLREQGIGYTVQPLSMEFGQPFRSLDDAIAFFRLYDKSGIAVTKETVEPRLVQTESADFPLYLPMRREMELIAFDAHEIGRER